MKRLWTDGITPPQFPKLTGDAKTEVLIIGGGMAGVLCARALRERGVECLLVEAKTLGSGVTQGTTAVLTAQHDTLYSDLIRKFGREKAGQYLRANLEAVEKFRSLAEEISCDFEEKPSYLYAQGDADFLRREVGAVRSLGFPAEFTTQPPLPFSVAGAERFPGMAQFHPLKFLHGAAQGLPIYEHTMVRKIEDGAAYTETGRIAARKIIVATHFPVLNRRGLYFMKLYQKRSFVVALENAPDLHGTYADTAPSGMYFRNYKNLLVVGGGDHRTGGKGGGFDAVREFVRRRLPQARERYAWAAQDCMSLDGVPYIGPYSPATKDLLVASGFNEWGMTSSMVAASILTDLATGRENPFAPVFAPQRSSLRAQLFANLGHTLADFAIPTTRRCPHLGCALRWNKDERTWDCPCHGSRFAADGALLNDPAQKDARV